MLDTSSASKKTARSCLHCRTRMSSPDFDSHTICSVCRNLVCSQNDRCAECRAWSDVQMSAYLKRKASLERKRLSKQRAKDRSRDLDFDLSCPGIPGPSPALDNSPLIADVCVDDSALSATDSVSKSVVQGLVTEQFSARFGV